MNTNRITDSEYLLRFGQKVRDPNTSNEGEIVAFVMDRLENEQSFQLMTLTEANIDSFGLTIEPGAPDPFLVLRVIIRKKYRDRTSFCLLDPDDLDILPEQP